ncbi:hypothetical protein RB614_25085 [Phytohabitans sp. ZYX-F-186]|uniref:Aminotransferase class I/classII domain-containing protein n=1 Tax=Phytohabitans maris TaxID=3071409 RepID=A0ABU0ZL73_9ACTN|nr:hypothetical protein [Phytohabitans sp. ZYX-F-186]MDQ7907801.1 hypothetical protein [Phytohabitans sp. ZYX-F-186]
MAERGALRGRPAPLRPLHSGRRAGGGRPRSAGVRVQALRDYHFGEPVREGLVIGYGAIPTERIGEGLRRLAAAFAPAL